MRKKVLLLSWHFPPYKSSSAFNLFKRLKDTGYEYDVLQIQRKDKPDNDIMFRYASSRFTRYEIQVPSENARDPEARAHFVEKVLDFYNCLKEHNHYSVMVSHSHEFVSHIAAMRIKKSDPQLSWVASFGDPIAANPYNDCYKFPMLDEDIRAEEQVLQIADRIIVTNEYQQEIVSTTQRIPLEKSKFYILPHCFDERMYHREPQGCRSEYSEPKIFRFRHVGMLYKYKRTSLPFILGAQRLLQIHPELKGCFTLEFYGANDQFIKSASTYGLESIVSFKGTLSYLESLKVMTNADCLLLRDADFSDQGLLNSPFYPGKLADYLGAKRPILAVTMAKGCVPDMLSMLGGISLTEDDVDGIADAMYSAIKGKITIDHKEAEYYSHKNTIRRAKQALTFDQGKRTILIAGHDLKFAKFIIEKINQRKDLHLLIDDWNGHDKHDEEKSLALLNNADVVFCEWGLGNLVWYSKNIKRGQKLIVRIHAQEIKTRHLDRCNHEKIDNYIFVSPYYFEMMIAEFSLKREKCKMIFNMVDTDILNKPKVESSKYNLGMIGDVPQSKRLDRALDIFEKLYKENNRYKLFVKGKRPEDYAWMHSKEKRGELTYFENQYERITKNGWEKNVIFEGFGPIEEWLQKIGHILSVSDNESFHLSVAEGMASGALPSILNWPGSEYIYPSKYISTSISTAFEKVTNIDSSTTSEVKQFSKRFCKDANTDKILALL
ncbi:hypothetical protein ACJJID_01630 [Microbulbifer sp. CnH-101-G]|uniref:hypothetical protein n=1 Tax=Microbulbifer sp. CnH-101-G TaxID=3243393 RepID=UPI00403982E8